MRMLWAYRIPITALVLASLLTVIPLLEMLKFTRLLLLLWVVTMQENIPLKTEDISMLPAAAATS